MRAWLCGGKGDEQMFVLRIVSLSIDLDEEFGVYSKIYLLVRDENALLSERLHIHARKDVI
jgi:hypothetical protein